MIVQDLDSVPILDYLGNEFFQSINENPERAEEFGDVLNLAFEFVESEYLKRKQVGNKKLALRYYLLLNYFKARKPLQEKLRNG